MLKINLLSFVFIVFNCFGQENYTTTTSKIKEVKIYSSGGIIKHSFSADISQGKNFIIIKEFGRNSGMDISSFKPDKKINLIRYESYNNNPSLYAEKLGKNKNFGPINDSIEFYKNANKKIEQELTLTRNSIGIVQKNQILGNPSSAEILKMIEFNQTTLKNLYKEEIDFQAKVTKNQSRISVLENKKYASSKDDETFNNNIIVLQITSDKRQTVNFEVNQQIQNANWRPYYVIKPNGIKSPLKISYKAKIQQNTGLEFKNIPIKLINESFSL